MSPDSPQPHHNIGVSYLAERRLEDAHEAFSRAATLGPQNAEHWYHLAVVEALAGRYGAASEFVDKAVELGGAKYAEMAKNERALRRLASEGQAEAPNDESRIQEKR